MSRVNTEVTVPRCGLSNAVRLPTEHRALPITRAGEPGSVEQSLQDAFLQPPASSLL